MIFYFRRLAIAVLFGHRPLHPAVFDQKMAVTDAICSDIQNQCHTTGSHVDDLATNSHVNNLTPMATEAVANQARSKRA